MTITFRWLESLDEVQRGNWQVFLQECEHAHPFQDLQWGEIARGAEQLPRYIMGEEDARIVFAALVLTRRVRGIRRERWIIPRGPVCADLTTLDVGLGFVEKMAYQRGVLIATVNPYWNSPVLVEDLLRRHGWQPNLSDGVHWLSLEVDLRRPADEILRSFRKTTRYEIQRGERAGVTVRLASSLDDMRAWFEIYRAYMTERGLGFNSWEFFRLLWNVWLADQSRGALVLAVHNGEICAGALILKYLKRAWYTFGARRPAQDLPLGYLPLWRGMLWSQSVGCETFDLGGWAKDAPRTSPVYGVALFKAGFSKHEVQFPREHTRIFRPCAYRAYRIFSNLRNNAHSFVRRYN